jgi:predicted HD phosphohydrolase
VTNAIHDELEAALMSLDGIVDGLEPVDELSHALQCAQLARVGNASRELIAAALFHDIARSPMVATTFPGVGHERAGARWLEPRLGPVVAWLVGAHVAAKLYLLERDPSYAALLSEESRRSAIGQRAPELAELARDSSWPDALRLRRWDDEAKRPDVELPEPSELLAIVRPLVLGPWREDSTSL